MVEAGAVGYITGGWGISGTSIVQSGYPLTAETPMVFSRCANRERLATLRRCSASDPAVAYQAGSGNYIADGETAASIRTRLATTSQPPTGSWLTGAIPKGDFAIPTFGQDGNEKSMAFRGPNFIETNVNFYKDTRITERVNFQFRFEIFNLFNRANYSPSITISRMEISAKQPHLTRPRFWQLGGKLSF